MDINSFAPCGLICGLCKDINRECKGCRYGGGDQNCHQLKCCKSKGIEGCWKCGDFPCSKGYFADSQWRGIITAFARCVREEGAETFYNTVRSGMGDSIDYEKYLFLSEQEIIKILKE